MNPPFVPTTSLRQCNKHPLQPEEPVRSRHAIPAAGPPGRHARSSGVWFYSFGSLSEPSPVEDTGFGWPPSCARGPADPGVPCEPMELAASSVANRRIVRCTAAAACALCHHQDLPCLLATWPMPRPTRPGPGCGPKCVHHLPLPVPASEQIKAPASLHTLLGEEAEQPDSSQIHHLPVPCSLWLFTSVVTISMPPGNTWLLSMKCTSLLKCYVHAQPELHHNLGTRTQALRHSSRRAVPEEQAPPEHLPPYGNPTRHHY